MSEMVIPRTEIIQDTDAILHIREEVIKTKIESVFTKISLMDYRVFKRVWPEISTSDTIPAEKVLLQTIHEQYGIPRNRISLVVESMNKKVFYKEVFRMWKPLFCYGRNCLITDTNIRFT